jgi:hypothetical protein
MAQDTKRYTPISHDSLQLPLCKLTVSALNYNPLAKNIATEAIAIGRRTGHNADPS